MAVVDDEEAREFAAKVVETMGSAEALLMAMRLVLLVGERTGAESPDVVAAAKDAIAAIKRIGTATGLLLQT